MLRVLLLGFLLTYHNTESEVIRSTICEIIVSNPLEMMNLKFKPSQRGQGAAKCGKLEKGMASLKKNPSVPICLHAIRKELTKEQKHLAMFFSHCKIEELLKASLPKEDPQCTNGEKLENCTDFSIQRGPSKTIKPALISCMICGLHRSGKLKMCMDEAKTCKTSRTMIENNIKDYCGGCRPNGKAVKPKSPLPRGNVITTEGDPSHMKNYGAAAELRPSHCLITLVFCIFVGKFYG